MSACCSVTLRGSQNGIMEISLMSTPFYFTNTVVFLSNGDESSKTWLVGEVEGTHPTVDLYHPFKSPTSHTTPERREGGCTLIAGDARPP